MSTGDMSSRITRWRGEYAAKYRVPSDVFASFGDDVADAMLKLIESGRSPREAYRVITNGLYAEQRAIAANRRFKRTSRRNKRTSRRKRSSR